MLIQVRTDGPPTARIMIVGEAPGAEEVQTGVPFSGASGQELNRCLHEAGIMRSECFVTNVARQQPPGNDISKFIPKAKKDITADCVQFRDKKVKPCLREGAELLAREIELVKPILIIALGNVALWALTGKWGITDWRGSQLEQDLVPAARCKVIPTYHPAALFRQWTWRPTLVHDLKRAKRECDAGREYSSPRYSFITRPSFEQALRTLGELLPACGHANAVKLSVDIETRGGHIACIGLAWSKTEAICIPFMDVQHKEGYWSEDEELAIIQRLREILLHPNCHVIGQNFLYDAQYIYRWWHFIPNVKRDTMIAQHACFSTMPKGLDFLSSMYCDSHVYWKGESKDWDPNVGEDQLWVYNCKDAVITYEVDESLQQTVDSMGLRGPHDFQQSMFWPVLDAMIAGVRIDKTVRSAFASELQEGMAEREGWFKTVLGHPLNPRSGPQMQKLFYEDFKQPMIFKRTPKGPRPTLDDGALRKIKAREPLLRPLINRIQEYRTLGVYFGTFISAPLDTDDRMRCSYNIAGTDTYRLSSSENAFGSGTNLQNIPGGGENDEDSDLVLPNAKKLFVPDPGHTMFDIDLSKADLRIVVWEADEPEMKAMLKEGRDPYVEIAREFYRDSTISKLRSDGSVNPKYDTFKRFAHGTHYLGSGRGIAERIGITVAEAERTQKWYFSKFPRIKTWQERMIATMKAKRFVQNCFGYRKYEFDRINDDALRAAAAWVPQSTIGLLINQIWLNTRKYPSLLQVLLQTHDSLTGQFPTARKDEALVALTECGKVLLPYPDPLVIPIGIKTSIESWGACA